MDPAQQEAELRSLVEDILGQARGRGADAAEVGVSNDAGLAVTVRMGEVETVEYNRDRGFGITVYFGQRKGSATTSDSSPESVKATVQAACDIAQFTSEDTCAGLADPDLMARDLPDLELHHPWGLDADEAIAIARRCEDAARESDERVSNSEGATVSTHSGVRVYGNSHGFLGSYPYSRHSLSCAVIAGESDSMQRDYWYAVARDAGTLEKPEDVGRRAALRAVSRLGGRQTGTGRFPVLYAAEVAGGLISHFFSAISGGNLYRKSSFLLDQLGKPVFPDFMQIREDPRQVRGLNSAAFDDEGVATRAKSFVADGVLESYLLSSYSARKLGTQTTGNAGGARNVYVEPGDLDRDGLLRKMGDGLLVTELMGFGINVVTGDYSRGCSGFWVENGEIAYPVEEITIASNLRDMFAGLVAVGSDVDHRGNIHCGSLLIEGMTLAGN